MKPSRGKIVGAVAAAAVAAMVAAAVAAAMVVAAVVVAVIDRSLGPVEVEGVPGVHPSAHS